MNFSLLFSQTSNPHLLTGNRFQLQEGLLFFTLCAPKQDSEPQWREKEHAAAAVCTAKGAPPAPEAWEFHPGESKQELSSSSASHHGSLFLIVL